MFFSFFTKRTFRKCQKKGLPKKATALNQTPKWSVILLFRVEQGSNKGPLYLQCALRTELLTAEAPYTLLTVDHRLAVLYHARLRGTDVCTYSAADTHILF